MTYRAPGIPTRIYYYTVVPVKSGECGGARHALMDDITEKVQLSEKARMVERHLASVVESANELVVSTDAEGRIVSWNAAAERISGYRTDEVRGWLLTDLCEAAQRDDMTAIIRRLAGGDVVKFHELNLATHSGGLVPVDWSCSPIRDDSGKVSGMVAVGRDLSERRAFEEHLYHSEKLAALGGDGRGASRMSCAIRCRSASPPRSFSRSRLAIRRSSRSASGRSSAASSGHRRLSRTCCGSPSPCPVTKWNR